MTLYAILDWTDNRPRVVGVFPKVIAFSMLGRLGDLFDVSAVLLPVELEDLSVTEVSAILRNLAS
jgi:hypothetical protein